jgi:uncharacterized alkaline shock family protein YloU
MSDYLEINNYSSLGRLRISRKAIRTIVGKSVGSVSGASLASGKKRLMQIASPISIVLSKEGKIKVSVAIILPVGSQVKDICLALQKEIATNLSMMIEAVPNEIHVRVASFA